MDTVDFEAMCLVMYGNDVPPSWPDIAVPAVKPEPRFPVGSLARELVLA